MFWIDFRKHLICAQDNVVVEGQWSPSVHTVKPHCAVAVSAGAHVAISPTACTVCSLGIIVIYDIPSIVVGLVFCYSFLMIILCPTE